MANKTSAIELKDLQKNAIEGDKLFENSKTVLYRNLAQTHVAKMASKNASKIEKQSNALKLMAKSTI